MFKNRKEFIEAASSEKITLAIVYPAQQVTDWVEDDTNIWKVNVPFLLIGLKTVYLKLLKLITLLTLKKTHISMIVAPMNYSYIQKLNQTHWTTLYSINYSLVTLLLNYQKILIME